MQVVGTANAGQVLVIASLITLGVLLVNSRGSVERLMDVTGVVDDETQSEGLGIGLEGEVLLDLLVVVAGLVIASVLQPVGQVFKSAHNVVSVHLEIEVREVTSFDQERLVNEVPAVLEVVGALYVVGKVGALREGVVFFIAGERSVGGREV